MATIRRSVVKRANGRWRARYFDPATKAWTAAGTHRTRTEGHEAIDLIVADIATGSRVPPERSNLTFAQYTDAHFWPSSAVTARTLEKHQLLYARYLKPRWGNTLLADIELEAIEAWVRQELPSTSKVQGGGAIGTSYQRQMYWLFHKIIARAVERHYLARSPLPGKSGLPSQQPRKVARVLDPTGVARLASAAAGVMVGEADVIYTAAYGGFRCGELLALRVDDLDFEHRQITVDEQVVVVGGLAVVQGDLKRARSHRTVPMPRKVMAMLAARVMRQNIDSQSALLFPDSKGGPRYPGNWRRRTFAPAVALSGLPYMTPHDLRHTAASAWFDEDYDIVEVARMLGDSLAVAEKIYVHLYRGRRPERMDAMDARIDRGNAGLAKVLPIRQADAG